MGHEDQVYDVIVCGAGPVGLFFAYQMIMKGHSVYILDQKSCPTKQSRAFFVTARSMEMFENHGIAKHILKKAYILRGAQLIIEGSEMNSVEPDEMVETIFPQLTCVPQSDTEHVIASLIEQKNTIYWNTKLVKYSVYESGISAVIAVDNGKKTKEIKGKYIIGADGSHSIVRNQDKSWTYEGYSSNIQFALADIVLSGRDVHMVKDKYNIFYHAKGMFLLIPINYNRHDKSKNLFRIIANTGVCEKAVKTKEDDVVTHGIPENDPYDLSMEEINSILKTRGESLDLAASDPQWRTHFYINERKANGFRRERVFLIGDAAHCHSPVGGQGMNLGLQDADNLAWKLSLVLKGLSTNPELLLDSYTKEREPIAEEVIRRSSSAAELTMGVDFVAAIFRYFVFSLNSGNSKAKENGMSHMLQLHLTIDGASPLIVKSHPSLIKTGAFLPETALLLKRSLNTESPTLDRKSLHQIVHASGKHIVLLVATRPKIYEPCSLVTTFWRKFQNNNNVRPLVIESVWHVPEYDLAEEIKKEIENCHKGNQEAIAAVERTQSENFWIEYHPSHTTDSITQLVGLQNIFNNNMTGELPPTALLIIRPDLYIAYSMLAEDEADVDNAISFLHTYLK